MLIAQKILNKLALMWHEPMMRALCSTYPSARFQRTCRIINGAKNKKAIAVGEESVIAGELVVYGDGGNIHIGSHCFVGPGSRIWAGENIIIGDRVLISHNVNIHDSPSHSLSAKERHEHFRQMVINKEFHLTDIPKSQIVIEDDAWIGFNASIMRGVRIGKGAIVAAGAFVTKDVPAFTIVAGPTAKNIGISKE